jgi:hypothetical protein
VEPVTFSGRCTFNKKRRPLAYFFQKNAPTVKYYVKLAKPDGKNESNFTIDKLNEADPVVWFYRNYLNPFCDSPGITQLPRVKQAQ